MTLIDYDRWTVRGVRIYGPASPRVEIIKNVNGGYKLHYYSENARSSSDHATALTFWGAKRKAQKIIKRKKQFQDLVKKELKKEIS